MNRLTILCLRGAAASDLDRPLRLTSRATRMHRYRVDGGTDENLAWIEVGGRRKTEKELSELSLPTGELFTFDLARDVGVSSASPWPRRYRRWPGTTRRRHTMGGKDAVRYAILIGFVAATLSVPICAAQTITVGT